MPRKSPVSEGALPDLTACPATGGSFAGGRFVTFDVRLQIDGDSLGSLTIDVPSVCFAGVRMAYAFGIAPAETGCEAEFAQVIGNGDELDLISGGTGIKT